MKILIILIFSCISVNLLATNQVKDILIYKGDTLQLYYSPLEQIEAITEKLFELDSTLNSSSICWRGFEAEWVIKDKALHLTKVTEFNTNKIINELVERIIGVNFKNGSIKADWVNGKFWAGMDYVSEASSVYQMIYKSETKFIIENGEVKNIELKNYSPCQYQSQDSIYKHIYSKIDWTNIKSNSRAARLSIYVVTNESGHIIHTEIESSTDPGFNNEILRLIRLLPCRNVYYSYGVFSQIGQVIELTLNKDNEVKYSR